MYIKLRVKRMCGGLVIVQLISFAVGTLFSSSLYAQPSRGGIAVGEGMPGQFVKRLPQSVFPHWLHRMWYTCGACHDEVFPMEKLPPGQVMGIIDRGRLCGVCHNGDISFGTKEKCGRCHQSSDTSGIVMFPAPRAVSIDEFDKVFKRLGIKWFPEKLKNRELIFDIRGEIDFDSMQFRDKVIRPKGFIRKQVEGMVRNNVIVFSPKSDFMDKVLFDHSIHSRLVSCGSCHEQVFVSKLDGNNVFMKDIADGKYCGLCHNGIAFSVDNCKKCHKKVVSEKRGSVLLRQNFSAFKQLNP